MMKSKRDWIELWHKMARGVKGEYDKIVATDVVEFWYIFDLWVDNVKAENSRYKNNQNK